MPRRQPLVLSPPPPPPLLPLACVCSLLMPYLSLLPPSTTGTPALLGAPRQGAAAQQQRQGHGGARAGARPTPRRRRWRHTTYHQSAPTATAMMQTATGTGTAGGGRRRHAQVSLAGLEGWLRWRRRRPRACLRAPCTAPTDRWSPAGAQQPLLPQPFCVHAAGTVSPGPLWPQGTSLSMSLSRGGSLSTQLRLRQDSLFGIAGAPQLAPVRCIHQPCCRAAVLCCRRLCAAARGAAGGPAVVPSCCRAAALNVLLHSVAALARFAGTAGGWRCAA